MKNLKKYYIKKLTFILVLALGFYAISCQNGKNAKDETKEVEHKKSVSEMSYIETSQALLESLKNGDDTNELKVKLSNASLDGIEKELDNDKKRLAFWVNTYNSYVILILKDHPEYYKNRDEFFTKDQINIGGTMLSFDKIEHGVIRHSTVKLSKGYLRDFFPGEFERRFRVQDKDPRIHFVLNCGANDCPPVYIYNPATLDADFDQVAKAYLQKKSSYNAAKNEVTTTPLFNYFTGDWGGRDGVKDFLSKYGILPEKNNKIELKFADYDWTMNINNFG
jgi:hypothetical protein